MATFVRIAVAFELGLVPLAFLIGWPAGVDPWGRFAPDLRGLAIGVAATLPMAVALLIFDRDSIGPMRRIRELLERLVLPSLRGRPIWQLALVAAAAGIGEETFFRGLIQSGLEAPLGPWPALAIASAVFGLLHAMTPTYAILAALIGVYLGVLFEATGDLTAPIVAHGLYDLIALIYFLRAAGGDTIGRSEPTPEEPLP